MDALGLAAALADAVTDPELHVTVLQMDAKQKQQVRTRLGPELAFVGVKDFDEYRQSLREFVAFCRKGAN